MIKERTDNLDSRIVCTSLAINKVNATESRVALYQDQVLSYNFQNTWVFFCPCFSTASITVAECDDCHCSSMLASPIHAYETRGDVATLLDCPQ